VVDETREEASVRKGIARKDRGCDRGAPNGRAVESWLSTARVGGMRIVEDMC
jgi:hypothetical protein